MDCDNTETLHLPQEIMEEEILSRVAVKSLLRFRCASKSWRSLIDSDWFIKNHHRISTKDTSLAHHRVIFDSNFSEMKQCSLQLMLDQPFIHPFTFDEEEADNNKPITGNNASVVGCFNGLFCIVNSSGTYFLWNPATKIFFKLPKIPPTELPYVRPKRGFGWDETSGAYKVFALSSDPDLNNKRVARVYSSRTNSWATVDHGSLSLHNEVGLYACGNLHWVTKSGDHHIESFDLKSEAFGKIEMPPLEGGEVGSLNRLRLGEVRGCLSVLHELEGGGVDVWIMKVHGLKESWQKLICIPRHDYRRRGCLVGPSPSGETLLISGRNFWVYDEVVKHKKTRGLYERWRCSVKDLFTGCYIGCIEPLDLNSYDTYFYVETLVSPIPR